MTNIIKQVINVGSQSNDGTGDSIRDAFTKVNTNFDTLYAVAGIGNGLLFTALQDGPSRLNPQNVIITDPTGLTVTQMSIVGADGIQISLNYTSNPATLVIASTLTSLASDPLPTVKSGSDLSGNGTARAINFADPKRDTDLVTKEWVENNFLNRDGVFQYDTGVGSLVSTSTIVEGSTLRHNIVLEPTAIQTSTNVGKVISFLNSTGTTSTINLAYQAWKPSHLTRKDYVDTKISLQGISTIDSTTGQVNPGFGQMTGALQLFRDPIETDNPLTAATKNYVDSTGFPSKSNFFVALNGNDNRTDIPTFKRGRSWAWAFRSVNKAAQAAEAYQNSSQIVLGPYVKTITTNNFTNPCLITQITSSNIPNAIKLIVPYDGSAGTDAFINTSIYPGLYIIGIDTGATAEILNVVSSGGTEFYEVVPVDYAVGFPTSVVALGQTGTVTINFTQQNLVAVPEFWMDYTFVLDDSVGGGAGTIIGSGTHYDAQGNVYDSLTVRVTKPFGQKNVSIPGSNWHVYAGDWTDPTLNTGGFSLAESLKYGQAYNKIEVAIRVESGEYDEDLPIRLADNVSVVGDEFRRSMIRPAKWPGTYRSMRSTSPYANLYFRRDTQLDGLIIVDLITGTNYASAVAITPDSVTNSALTGVVNFTLASGTALPSWKDKVFVGAGGRGVITQTNANVFSVNLAENVNGVRALNSSTAIASGAWSIYAPINFGYHYLKDPSRPMNLLGWEPGGALSNPGGYNVASETLMANRTFIQEEVIKFLDATYPSLQYNRAKCKRDVGIIVEGIADDLQVGSVSKTINIPESYFSASDFYVYTNQLTQTTSAITQIGVLASQIMSNTTVTAYQSTVTQVFAGVSLEPDASTKVIQLTTTINTILNNSDPTYNPGKFNNQLDIFLMNDATMIRYLAGQGHGGFMKVLDPYGQVKAKSPYTQTASSFSESTGRHRFAGGFFVDGFTGNMQLTPTASTAGSNSAGDYVSIPVQGYALKLRKPLTPSFFISNGIQYQVDFISNWNPTANTNYGTATLNLDPNKYGGIESVNLSGTLNTFRPSSQIPLTISSPGTAGGLTARGYAATDGSGTITGITITYSGNGYVRATDPGYNATNNAITYTLGGAVLTPTIVQGAITAITVSNPGSGYTTNTPINISAPTTVGGTTARATITSVNATGGITSVTVTNGFNGSGYTSAPKFTFGNSNISYVTVIRKGYIGNLPSTVEMITAGNRSMLANDYTQLNDYAYGIFATNGGLIENVSMFTYYCWTSYYALNGAQLRTITGSSAYGNYGLIAEGSDPNEIPIAISFPDELSQVVAIYNQPPYSNVIGGTSIYFTLGGAISFIPFDQSLLEINHKGLRKTYTVKGATFVTTATNGSYVYSLSIDTSVSSGGLFTAVPDGTPATIRTGNQFRLSGVNAATITRPSTVLSVSEDPTNVYRILTYTGLGNDVALAEADQLYDYMTIQPYRQNDQYRQGVTNPLITGGGNGYSGSTATITFSAPSPTTVSASVNGDQGTSSSPIQSFLISGQTSIIHPGMSVSGSGVLANTYVLWSSSATNTVAFNQSQFLSGGTTLTFSGVTAAGYAVVSNGTVSSVVITEPGVGYNTPPTATVATPGGGSSATVVVSLAGIAGSNYVKVVDVGAQSYARLQLAQSSGYVYRFGYDGRVYNITNYTPPSTTTPWGQLTVSSFSTGTGLVSEMTADPLYAGVQANTTGSITVRISTLRATSHDMVNIGTGGYATTRYPNDLYGPPLIAPQQSQEVIEKSKGRVYYVTADQDGNFRVGKYFRVDQGRGTVTINAPISLSGVNSLSFKKGVEINEFSIDQTMAAESNSKVPTEQTIVGYLNARLGVTRTGALFNGTGASIGPGYLPMTGTPGIPMRGSIDMGFVANITNLPPPTGQSYAANKDYVDTKISLAGQNEVQANGGQLAGKMTGPLVLSGSPATTSLVTTRSATTNDTLLYVNTSTLYLGMRLNNSSALAGTYISSIGNGYALLSTGLASPISSGTNVIFDPIYQAASKQYVDSGAQVSKLRDVSLTNPTNLDLLMFTTQSNPSINQPVPFYNTATVLVNVSNNTSNPSNTSVAIGGGSDVAFSRSNNSLTIKLTGGTLGGANNPITDYHVNAAAQIQQSKLLMTTAFTRSTAPTGTQQQIQQQLGLTAFDSSYFTTTNGWMSLNLGNNIVPNATNTYSLGSTSTLFKAVWATTLNGALDPNNLSTTVPVAKGGTGKNTSISALNALLDSIGGNQSGYVLTTQGLGNYQWAAGGGGGGTATGTRINTSSLLATATAGQTVFTTPQFSPNSQQLKVYINGVRQSIANGDYTEGGTGLFMTFNAGLTAGDLVLLEVDGYISYTITAVSVVFSPVGGISATDVQNAISQLDSAKFAKSGGSISGSVNISSGGLTLPAGTTTVAPLTLTGGVNLTTPVAGSVEFNGTDLFWTQTSGPTRQTVASQAWVTSQNYQTALGFTPVQQGGGGGQSTNKVYIGWSGSNLRVQVDSTDFGATWPIGISGTAAVATSANGLNSANDYTVNNLTANGYVYANGNVTAYSDERLKTNITTITGALDKVLALRGVSYTKDGKVNIGVVAQETKPIVPEVVHDTPDGYLSVAYGNLVGLLIEAVKELKAEVSELKAEVDELKQSKKV
jgi:hypothetical protein